MINVEIRESLNYYRDAMVRGEFYIGTCSWKFESWRGLLYSDPVSSVTDFTLSGPGKVPTNYLAEYSQRLGTVEIDQWFWSLFPGRYPRLPTIEVVEEYRESVPQDFKFAVKIPNSITLTHYYQQDKSAPLVENPHFLSTKLFSQFLNCLEPMQGKLGPLMFQFEYLNKNKMASAAEFQNNFSGFITQLGKNDRIGKILNQGMFHVEIRNPNYLTPTYFEFLREYRLGHVFMQGYYMPDILSTYDKYKDYIEGATVIRLMGRDRKAIEKLTADKWDQIVDPKDEELGNIISMINELLDRKIDVWLFVNNHYEGSAPLTIQKIVKMLSGIERPGEKSE
jgi:uncharacterized protein YecE (DUF72 family)